MALEPFWMGLAVDVVTQEFTILSFSDEREEALRETEEKAHPDHQRRVFNVLAESFAPECIAWLRSEGIAHQVAVMVIRAIGCELDAIFTEIFTESGAKPALAEEDPGADNETP